LKRGHVRNFVPDGSTLPGKTMSPEPA